MILGMYHPKRGGANPDFDEQSMQLLRLKDRDGQAIASFYKRIEPLLGSGFSIAVVPSRDAARTGTGMRDLAQRLTGMAAPTPHPAWFAIAPFPNWPVAGTGGWKCTWVPSAWSRRT